MWPREDRPTGQRPEPGFRTYPYKWDLCDDLIIFLLFANDGSNRAMARSLCADGVTIGAKERAGWASQLFPSIGLEMVDDPELEGVL